MNVGDPKPLTIDDQLMQQATRSASQQMDKFYADEAARKADYQAQRGTAPAASTTAAGSSGFDLLSQGVAQQHAARDAVRVPPGAVPADQFTPEESAQIRGTGIVPPRLRGSFDTSSFTGYELVDYGARGKLPDRIVLPNQSRDAARLAELETQYVASGNGATMPGEHLIELQSLRAVASARAAG